MKKILMRLAMVAAWLVMVACWLAMVACWLVMVACWLVMVACWLVRIACRAFVTSSPLSMPAMTISGPHSMATCLSVPALKILLLRKNNFSNRFPEANETKHVN